MKYIFTLLMLVLVGCAGVQTLPEAQPETPVVEVTKAPLAWGKSHSDWDKYLYDAVEKAPDISSAKNMCTKLSHKDCLAQLISKMAQYESSYKPSSFFPECSKDKCVYSDGCNKVEGYGYCMKGNPKYDNGLVISSGLLQISTSSAISYGCDVKSKEDLTDPKKNLECAVKIATKWIAKDGAFYKNGTKEGMGRYWSVMRDTSKSKPKILDYMKQF